MAGDEQALALGQQVAHQVGDGVGLAGARGALNQHRAVGGQAASHALLLRVGRHGVERVDVAHRIDPGGRPSRFDDVSLQVDVKADHAHQGWGQGFQTGQGLEEGLDGRGEAQRATAQIEYRLARELHLLLGRAQVGQISDHPDPGPELVQQIAQRIGILGATQNLAALLGQVGTDLEALQQSAIEPGLAVGLAEGELGPLGLELESELLQHQGMVNRSLVVLDAHQPQSDDQLDRFRLALEPSPHLQQPVEQVVDVVGGQGRLLPVFAAFEPGRQGGWPRLIGLKGYHGAAFLLTHESGHGSVQPIPPRLEPAFEGFGKGGAGHVLGAAHAQEEVFGLLTGV